MADVLLLHSCLGVRPALHDLAATLREDGHVVHVPDLYDGATFDDVDAGVAFADELSLATVRARLDAAVADLPEALVPVGFSWGAIPATLLLDRPGTRALVLVQGVVPPPGLGLDGWPSGVPVQVHHSRGDEWCTPEEVDEVLGEQPAEVVDHGVAGHLFMDPGLDVHDADATASFTASLRGFLARLDAS